MNLSIKVVPGSSRDEISGWLGGALKIRVKAPPQAGRANKAVAKIIAEALQVSPDQVSIVRGHSSARKLVEIRGLIDVDIFSKLPPKPT